LGRQSRRRSERDTLIGGIDDDIYIVWDNGDILIERANEGTDTIWSEIDYTLQSNFENLTLLAHGWRNSPPLNLNGVGNSLDNVITGNGGMNILNGLDGADRIDGGFGDDHLYGGIGNDTLKGEGDNDVLWGSFGVDVLIGGFGADHYYFADANDSRVSGNGVDEIVDFSAAEGDKIDFSAIDADINTAGNQTFSFIGNNNFFAVGQVHFDGGFVEGDVNGDLSADFRIQVNAPTLAAADFIL
jgi:Ca2+-binding RTX toxin-like protein